MPTAKLSPGTPFEGLVSKIRNTTFITTCSGRRYLDTYTPLHTHFGVASHPCSCRASFKTISNATGDLFADMTEERSTAGKNTGTETYTSGKRRKKPPKPLSTLTSPQNRGARFESDDEDASLSPQAGRRGRVTLNTSAHLLLELGPRFGPPDFTMLRKRLLYTMRFFERPVSAFFFSAFATLGVWFFTLPARAKLPCTFPMVLDWTLLCSSRSTFRLSP